MPKGKGPKQDIAGMRYGRLVAISFTHFNEKFDDCWLFRCDCGTEKVMPADYVKWGRVRSCGCLVAEHIQSLNRQDIPAEDIERLRELGDYYSKRRATSFLIQTHKKKVGRNDPCPCGSGKKYKHCCGRYIY